MMCAIYLFISARHIYCGWPSVLVIFNYTILPHVYTIYIVFVLQGLLSLTLQWRTGTTVTRKPSTCTLNSHPPDFCQEKTLEARSTKIAASSLGKPRRWRVEESIGYVCSILRRLEGCCQVLVARRWSSLIEAARGCCGWEWLGWYVHLYMCVLKMPLEHERDQDLLAGKIEKFFCFVFKWKYARHQTVKINWTRK